MPRRPRFGPVSALRQRARMRLWRALDRGPVRHVPAGVAGRLGLPPPPGARRVEVGSGFSPRPGYVHVDTRPGLPHLDLVAPGDVIPLPAGWADELLAVHMVEHVPAGALEGTLRHWHALLRPGGVLTLHTPNATALGRLLADPATPTQRLWPVLAALYGYDRAPWDATSPGRLGLAPDHKLVFTFPLLRDLLEGAGFADVRDVSGSDPECHHTRDWADVVPGLCLEVRAVRP